MLQPSCIVIAGIVDQRRRILHAGLARLFRAVPGISCISPRAPAWLIAFWANWLSCRAIAWTIVQLVPGGVRAWG